MDLLIERPDGRLIAVEVKAGASVRPTDAKRLAWMRDQTGDRFQNGIVRHTGQHPLRLSDRILALPMSHLWQHWPQRHRVSPGVPETSSLEGRETVALARISRFGESEQRTCSAQTSIIAHRDVLEAMWVLDLLFA